jgi:hypothetical protein
MSTDQDLLRNCKNIADQLTNPEDWRKKHAENNDITELEDIEALGAYDWLEDALDIEYRVSGDHSYKSGQVCVTVGGPNIFVDTEDNTVIGYWGGDKVTVPFIDNLGLDDVLEEMWSNY